VSATAHRFIVIEGPIGVGKTSLARRVSESLSAQLVLEQADQNPFLERFYRSPRSAAFATQLFFLFQRARQMEEVRQQDLFGAVRVADFLLEKDRLFARVTLDDAEYALYEKVCWIALRAEASAMNRRSTGGTWTGSPRRMRVFSMAMTLRHC
jgi:deoxyguanosine kinase